MRRPKVGSPAPAKRFVLSSRVVAGLGVPHERRPPSEGAEGSVTGRPTSHAKATASHATPRMVQALRQSGEAHGIAGHKTVAGDVVDVHGVDAVLAGTSPPARCAPRPRRRGRPGRRSAAPHTSAGTVCSGISGRRRRAVATSSGSRTSTTTARRRQRRPELVPTPTHAPAHASAAPSARGDEDVRGDLDADLGRLAARRRPAAPPATRPPDDAPGSTPARRSRHQRRVDLHRLADPAHHDLARRRRPRLGQGHQPGARRLVASSSPSSSSPGMGLP